MKSRTTARFRDLLAELPAPARRQAEEAYRRFRIDPYHPSLRFKPVSTSGHTVYSARVGLHHRVLGAREGDSVVWFWIGTHAEYDRLLRRL